MLVCWLRRKHFEDLHDDVDVPLVAGEQLTSSRLQAVLCERCLASATNSSSRLPTATIDAEAAGFANFGRLWSLEVRQIRIWMMLKLSAALHVLCAYVCCNQGAGEA
ncbi:hypothetical protein M758_UG207700 [Ceratodon purpureus]|nr:hypothetical protein M758_UG207700 [Ceratodon purpureus]